MQCDLQVREVRPYSRNAAKLPWGTLDTSAVLTQYLLSNSISIRMRRCVTLLSFR
jgi:hypothetical protein